MEGEAFQTRWESVAPAPQIRVFYLPSSIDQFFNTDKFEAYLDLKIEGARPATVPTRDIRREAL
jgi:hypothetical protein